MSGHIKVPGSMIQSGQRADEATSADRSHSSALFWKIAKEWQRIIAIMDSINGIN